MEGEERGKLGLACKKNLKKIKKGIPGCRKILSCTNIILMFLQHAIMSKQTLPAAPQPDLDLDAKDRPQSKANFSSTQSFFQRLAPSP